MVKGRRAADRRRERERRGKETAGVPAGTTSPDTAPARSDEDEEYDDEDGDDAPPQGRIADARDFVEQRSLEQDDDGLPEVSAVPLAPRGGDDDDDVDPDALTRSRLALPASAASGSSAKGGTKPGRARRPRVDENPDAEAAFQQELRGEDLRAAAADDEVTVERPAPDKPPSRGGRLLALAGPDAGGKVGLEYTSVVVGRSQHVDVQLSDPAVSLRHCEITYVDGEGFRLLDLGSTSGTLVNGRPALDAVELKHGDVVALGRSELRFLRAKEAPVEKPREPSVVAPPPKEKTKTGVVVERTGRDPTRKFDPTQMAPAPTGRTARPVVHVIVAILVVALVGSVVAIGWSFGFSTGDPSQVQAQVRALVDESTAHLKRKDLEGARARVETILALDPENADARSIGRMVETETESRAALQQAKKLADEDRAEEAHALLKKVPDASVFVEERDVVRGTLRKRAVDRSRARVQELVRAGRMDEALLFLRGHLEIWPDDEDARAYEELITAERTKGPAPDPAMTRAKAAFAAGDRAAARAAAEAGGAATRAYLEDLDRFERALDDGARALQKKDGAAAVGPFDDAWRLLQRLGGDKNGVVAKSFKKAYADAAWLAGVAALDGGDQCDGARRILLAAELSPEDPKVRAKLREVSTTAEQGLVRARAAAASDKGRAKAIAREALCGAPRGSATYAELAALAR